MNKTTAEDTRSHASRGDRAPRRLGRRLPEAMLGLVVVGLGFAVWATHRPEDGEGSASAPRATSPSAPATAPARAPAPAPPSVSSVDLRYRLVGRWLRPDGGYILTVKTVAEDGTVAAIYNNPNPVHVSRAQTVIRDGLTILAVELRDRGYPGNYYALKYDPASDRLTGTYYHLGIGQKFEVVFQRLGKEESPKE